MRPTAGDGMLAPITMLALALWLLNDHLLQLHAPGIVSGKLGDVASLVVLPIATQAAAELVGRERVPVASTRLALACCALWAAVFTLMETTALGSWAFRATLGALQWPARALIAGEAVPLRLVAHVADAADLLTLPALWLPYRQARARAARAKLSASCLASSAAPPTHRPAAPRPT